MRRALIAALLAISALATAQAADPRVETGFGSNPGNLRMFSYVPEGLPPSAPLIVVLHGCKQEATTFARDAGWLALADRSRLALLLPEQRGLPWYLQNIYLFPWVLAWYGANNPIACFNWFEPDDIVRDRGEALSIRQMIDAMAQRYAIDRSRIFIVGLSAGGAMSGVMLAAYPELFSGGAIVAGVPYGCANTANSALDCMSPGVDKTPAEWRARVREVSGIQRRVQSLSIWQGSNDQRVAPDNQRELLDQWLAVLGIPATVVHNDNNEILTRDVYTDSAGKRVESVRVKGLEHAYPIRKDNTGSCGQRGNYVVETKVCATTEIARFWGLIGNP